MTTETPKEHPAQYCLHYLLAQEGTSWLEDDCPEGHIYIHALRACRDLGISTPKQELLPFCVEYTDRTVPRNKNVHFFCQATDNLHAREQCKNAYPDAFIKNSYYAG